MKEFYQYVLVAAVALVCVASADQQNSTVADDRTGKGENLSHENTGFLTFWKKLIIWKNQFLIPKPFFQFSPCFLWFSLRTQDAKARVRWPVAKGTPANFTIELEIDKNWTQHNCFCAAQNLIKNGICNLQKKAQLIFLPFRREHIFLQSVKKTVVFVSYRLPTFT